MTGCMCDSRSFLHDAKDRCRDTVGEASLRGEYFWSSNVRHASQAVNSSRAKCSATSWHLTLMPALPSSSVLRTISLLLPEIKFCHLLSRIWVFLYSFEWIWHVKLSPPINNCLLVIGRPHDRGTGYLPYLPAWHQHIPSTPIAHTIIYHYQEVSPTYFSLPFCFAIARV